MDRKLAATFVIFILKLVYTKATPGFFINSLITEDAPGLTNLTTEIKAIEDDQIVGINMTIFKRLNNQLMVNFKLSKAEGSTMKKLFQAPKFNYCDLRRHGGFVPIVTDLLKTIESYGNLIFKCPAEPGVYYVKNVFVNKLPMMSLISTGDYFIMAEMIDENRRSRSELVVRFKVNVSKK